MILADVNLLVYAHREEFDQHRQSRQWLEGMLTSGEPFGMANVVLSGFVRLVTHRKIFSPPSTMAQALGFANTIRDRANCVAVNPGDRHWRLFVEFCGLPDVKAGLVTDAYLAALAVEHGCEFATIDGDFARFSPPLRLHRPF
ncbi:MAG: type II toxin-antitoxin system VapC family toxin [Thermoanaerobaculia bacterium]